MVDHINAAPVNRTFLALALHPQLEQFAAPPFSVTVVYGDDGIFGDSKRNA